MSAAHFVGHANWTSHWIIDGINFERPTNVDAHSSHSQVHKLRPLSKERINPQLCYQCSVNVEQWEVGATSKSNYATYTHTKHTHWKTRKTLLAPHSKQSWVYEPSRASLELLSVRLIGGIRLVFPLHSGSTHTLTHRATHWTLLLLGAAAAAAAVSLLAFASKQTWPATMCVCEWVCDRSLLCLQSVCARFC